MYAGCCVLLYSIDTTASRISRIPTSDTTWLMPVFNRSLSKHHMTDDSDFQRRTGGFLRPSTKRRYPRSFSSQPLGCAPIVRRVAPSTSRVPVGSCCGRVLRQGLLAHLPVECRLLVSVRHLRGVVYLREGGNIGPLQHQWRRYHVIQGTRTRRFEVMRHPPVNVRLIILIIGPSRSKIRRRMLMLSLGTLHPLGVSTHAYAMQV